MAYETLAKIFRQDPAAYEAAYNKRYNSPSAVHFDILIKQYGRRKAYPLFFNYTSDMVLLMEQVYKAYEELLLTSAKVPDIVLRQFVLLSILEEIKSSNDIEGVQSTRKELKKILDGEAPKSARFSTIVNKYKSLLSGEEIDFTSCQALRNFYDDFAQAEIAAEEPANSLDGELFRKGPVDITSSSGKTIHRGSWPESNIIAHMEKALAILHEPSLPFLIRLGLFHYLFAYIHPFYDGNGRTVRFITSYFLSRHFNKIAALRLSVVIKKHRKKYYALFKEADSEIDRADLTPFILGFLSFLATGFADTVRCLTAEEERLRAYEDKLSRLQIKDPLLKELYRLLLHATLFYGQGLSIAELVKNTARARGTVQKRLEQIPKKQLVLAKVHKSIYYKLDLKMFE